MSDRGDRFWCPPALRAWRAAASLTAVAAGIVALVVAALLLWNHCRFTAADPLESPELKALKTRLDATPKDEPLKARIRRLDLQLRDEYFARRDFSRRGIYLLAAAATVCLLAARLSALWARKLPHPGKPPAGPADMRLSALGRWATAAVGLMLVAVAAAVTVASRPPRGTPADYPSPQEIGKNWPRFRGPGGLGASAYADVPVSWNGKNNEGILWKSPVPLPGKSSPVLWGGRVFLTGATKDVREIYCFDADTGELKWRHRVGDIPGRGKPPTEVLEDTGFAAPTPVTDGKRLCAIFANGDLVCLDPGGRRIWARNLGTPDNPYGHASSLVMYRHTLLVQFDQAHEDDNKSRLIAIDVRTGREVWRKGRRVGASWTTPILISTPEGRQLITCSNPWVIAYDPASGAEIWRANCLDGDGAPSPIFAGGLVLATNVGSALAAIRPDGRGDVTESHIIWKAEDGLPDIASPASDGELVLLATEGHLTCYDVAGGTKVWAKELKASFISSPSVAAGRFYVTTELGETFILRAGRKYERIATARLGEKCEASLAFGPGRIYMRGQRHLFCIGGARP